MQRLKQLWQDYGSALHQGHPSSNCQRILNAASRHSKSVERPSAGHIEIDAFGILVHEVGLKWASWV